MTTVVFTGPAKIHGQLVVREQLVRASNAAGFIVAKTWTRAADFLVASRTDTVKSRRAYEEHKTVFTYADYVQHLKDFGVDLFDSKFAVNCNHDKYADGAIEEPQEYGPGEIVL